MSGSPRSALFGGFSDAIVRDDLEVATKIAHQLMDQDLSQKPLVLQQVVLFLMALDATAVEFDQKWARLELVRRWKRRVGKYANEFAIAVANRVPAVVTEQLIAGFKVSSAKADHTVLCSDSQASWLVREPSDGHGPAIVCQGSARRECRQPVTPHMVRPWLNQRQLDLLTLFEFDHTIEQRTLKDWFVDSADEAVKSGGRVEVRAGVVYGFLCTDHNLRVAFRHPCHDRSRHDWAGQPQGRAVIVHS